jgi:hypothetical protein
MFCKLGSEMPITASFSAVFSAACPVAKTEEDLSANTLLYDVIGAKHDARVKHACFNTGPVEPLDVGASYC